MFIAKKYGGPEQKLIDEILVIEQIAKYCGITARIVVETNFFIERKWECRKKRIEKASYMEKKGGKNEHTEEI